MSDVLQEYPEHEKLRALDAQKQGAELLMDYLLRQHLVPVLFSLDEVAETIARRSPTHARQLSELAQEIDRWHRYPRTVVFAALGIDWDTFWAEKEAMLAEIVDYAGYEDNRPNPLVKGDA